MYVCDVTLSVYAHRASLKNMPGRGGNRTYDLYIYIYIYRQVSSLESYMSRVLNTVVELIRLEDKLELLQEKREIKFI